MTGPMYASVNVLTNIMSELLLSEQLGIMIS